jgi:hypothetical protein
VSRLKRKRSTRSPSGEESQQQDSRNILPVCEICRFFATSPLVLAELLSRRGLERPCETLSRGRDRRPRSPSELLAVVWEAAKNVSAVWVGRLRYCSLARVLLHDLVAIRLLDDRLDILEDVPRHDGESGGVAAQLHVLGVCEGNLLNAIKIAAFAEEARHSRLCVHDVGHPLIDLAKDCFVAGETILARPLPIALSQDRPSFLLLHDLVGAVLFHDSFTWERRMVADDHESVLVSTDGPVLFERQVDPPQARVVRALA